MGPVSKRGQKVLNAVVDYLYWSAQQCRNTDEQIPIKLALALCGAIRRGDQHPFESACYNAFGGALENYTRKRLKEKFQQAYELRKCIPTTVPDGGRDMDTSASERVVTMRSRQKAANEEKRGEQTGTRGAALNIANARKG